jgi:hypothetical protein
MATSSLNKISRYPIEYRQLLMQLPADGTPLVVPFPESAQAGAERLKYYNFLKFLQRNPKEAEQFGNRPSMIMIRHVGNTLEFSLRTPAAKSAIRDALNAAGIHVPADDKPRDPIRAAVLYTVPDDSASFSLDAALAATQDQEGPARENPFDLIRRAAEEKKDEGPARSMSEHRQTAEPDTQPQSQPPGANTNERTSR